MMRPNDDEYATPFGKYVGLVPESDVVAVLADQLLEFRRLIPAVTPENETYAYAPGKWTIREVAGHVGDGERVFGFRAFSFSRADPNPLPGFEENDYVAQARFNDLPLADLIAEFAALREANLSMLRGLRDSQWAHVGIANAHPITVRALAFVMAGHVRHHLGLLHDRYGVAT